MSPVIFISYAWTNNAFRERVINLADRLTRDGVKVKIDAYDVRPGSDLTQYMESCVTDPTVKKVLIICNRNYKQKADRRNGGVGIEATIISPKVLKQVEERMFIPIYFDHEHEADDCKPAFISSKTHIDLSNNDGFEYGYEELLRDIFDCPKYVRPELGVPPNFLQQSTISSETSMYDKSLRALIGALSLTNDPALVIKYEDYIVTLGCELDTLRIKSDEMIRNDPFDEMIYQRIKASKKLRDDFEVVHLALTRHKREDLKDVTRKIISKFMNLRVPPEGDLSYNDNQFEHFKFIGYEFTLLLVACLIKEERYDTIYSFSTLQFFTWTGSKKDYQPLCILCHRPHKFEEARRIRVCPNRISPTRDIMEERINHNKITFQDLQEADFFLSLVHILNFDKISKINGYRRSVWYPQILEGPIYMRIPELIVKAKSRRIFNKIFAPMEISDVHILCEKYTEGNHALGVDGWVTYFSSNSYEPLDFKELIPFHELALIS